MLNQGIVHANRIKKSSIYTFWNCDNHTKKKKGKQKDETSPLTMPSNRKDLLFLKGTKNEKQKWSTQNTSHREL